MGTDLRGRSGRGKLWRAAEVMVAASAVAAVLIVSPGASAAKAQPRCDGHRAYRRTTSLLVFRVKSTQADDVGNPLTYYYACLRPNGKPIAIAADSTPQAGEYVPNDVLKELVLAGDFGASLILTGQGDQEACQKYGQPSCPSPWTKLFVANVRSRKTVVVHTPDGTTGLTLSPAGAAAWLVSQGSGAVRLMAGVLAPTRRGLVLPAQLLDTGQITHVRFSGLTLSWLNVTQQHTATLR